MVVLKQLLVSNPLSRLIFRFRPMVAADVFKGVSPNSRRMIHTSYPDTEKREDAENRYFYIGMAGVKKEDVELSCELYGFNELKIIGDGVTKYESKFNLPRNTTLRGIVADMKDGELKVNIPKGEAREEKFEIEVY